MDQQFLTPSQLDSLYERLVKGIRKRFIPLGLLVTVGAPVIFFTGDLSRGWAGFLTAVAVGMYWIGFGLRLQYMHKNYLRLRAEAVERARTL